MDRFSVGDRILDPYLGGGVVLDIPFKAPKKYSRGCEDDNMYFVLYDKRPEDPRMLGINPTYITPFNKSVKVKWWEYRTVL